MSLRVAFEGGPADGTVKEYPLAAALPSLFWDGDEPPYVAAIYRRASSEPDPVTGRVAVSSDELLTGRPAGRNRSTGVGRSVRS
jgi:hypothetical protein